MPFIDPVDEADATGKVAELYAEDREDQGYVANLTRAFSHAPDVLETWRSLITAIRGRMDPRRYELVTVAAAQRLGSSYCMLAHGSILASQFYDAEGVVRILSDPAAAGLDETDVAVMELARKVAEDAGSVEAADVDG